MTSSQAESYTAEQQAAVLAAVAVAGTAAAIAGTSIVNYTVFLRFLRLIWPAILTGRERAAWSARNFFDRERQRVTGLPRLDVPLLPDYEFDWFVKDMKPAYMMAVKQIKAARELEKTGIPAPPPKIESAVRVVTARIVANAGREQMIGAVEADAERSTNLRDSKKELKQMRKTWGGQWAEQDVTDLDADKAPDVIAWARVTTGDETCAWCVMLASRGPVYTSAKSAGVKKKAAARALELFGAGAKIPMNEWHTGCDCTVVPVYDENDWPGKDAFNDALEQWKAASEGFVYDPKKKYRFGQQKPDGTWTFRSSPVTEGAALYRETLNNLRFTVEGRDPTERQKVSKDAMDEILSAVPGASKLFAKELARR